MSKILVVIEKTSTGNYPHFFTDSDEADLFIKSEDVNVSSRREINTKDSDADYLMPLARYCVSVEYFDQTRNGKDDLELKIAEQFHSFDDYIEMAYQDMK